MAQDYSIVNKAEFPEVDESVQTCSPAPQTLLISVYNKIENYTPCNNVYGSKDATKLVATSSYLKRDRTRGSILEKVPSGDG